MKILVNLLLLLLARRRAGRCGVRCPDGVPILAAAGRDLAVHHAQRRARTRGHQHRHRGLAATLGRVVGHRRRHRRRGRRAGRDARDGRRLQGHVVEHRRHRHRDRPARRFAGGNQFGDHARPGAADLRARRHREGPRRSSDRVAGAVAGREPAEQGRRHRYQRAVPRRRAGCMGDPPEPQDRRRPQVQRRPARDGRRARRAEAVPRAGSRQATQARQPDLDGGRRVRIGRLERIRTVGRRRRAGPGVPAPGVPVGDGETRRQGRLQAIERRARRRSAPEARRVDDARLLRQAIRRT